MHQGKTMRNAYHAATIIGPSNARNTPSRTSMIDPRLEMANAKTKMTKVAIAKSSANNSLTLNKQMTSIPRPVSSVAGEV